MFCPKSSNLKKVLCKTESTNHLFDNEGKNLSLQLHMVSCPHTKFNEIPLNSFQEIALKKKHCNRHLDKTEECTGRQTTWMIPIYKDYCCNNSLSYMYYHTM